MNNIEKENQELKTQMGSFENINFQFISKDGNVKMIKWGKDYNSWPCETKLEYAESLASAMNEACEVIQNERNEKILELENLTKIRHELETALSTQRTITINTITKANSDKQELIALVKELEVKLAEAEAQIKDDTIQVITD